MRDQLVILVFQAKTKKTQIEMLKQNKQNKKYRKYSFQTSLMHHKSHSHFFCLWLCRLPTSSPHLHASHSQRQHPLLCTFTGRGAIGSRINLQCERRTKKSRLEWPDLNVIGAVIYLLHPVFPRWSFFLSLELILFCCLMLPSFFLFFFWQIWSHLNFCQSNSKQQRSGTTK